MTTALITHPACLDHDPGEWHPECPDRLRAVLGALEAEEFAPLLREAAPQATLEQLALVPPGRVCRGHSQHPPFRGRARAA